MWCVLRALGVDLSPIERVLPAAVPGCRRVAVFREPVAIELESSHRRELRTVDPLSRFAVVGVVEEPAASAVAFGKHIPNVSWGPVFEEVARLNPWYVGDGDPTYELALARTLEDSGETGLFYAPPERPCPRDDWGADRYLWLHSYGFGPLEPIRGEGVNGWRIVFARVLALAKKSNSSVILPCVRHSVLVPCGVSGWLTSPDPLENSADDDFVPEEARISGVSLEMRRWLELESAAAKTKTSLFDYDDDASRGVRHLKVSSAEAYFDVDAIQRFLGYPVLSVECASLLPTTKMPVTFASAKTARAEDLLTSTGIIKFGGGFDLGTMRDAVPRSDYLEVEEGPLRGFAPRLHAAARKFRKLLVGRDKPVAVVHWRSETLVARRDSRAPDAFRECATLVLNQTRHLVATHAVVLVSDIPFKPERPLWISFDNKVKRAHPQTPAQIRAFLREFFRIGGVKLDALADRYASYDFLDLGALGIIDQIIALDADLFATHTDSPNTTLAEWPGVGFNDCGYAGRFMRTILTRRLAAGAKVANWYVPVGFRPPKQKQKQKQEQKQKQNQNHPPPPKDNTQRTVVDED